MAARARAVLLAAHQPSRQSIDPRIKVFAAEPKACDDAARSKKAGTIVLNEPPVVTVADGLKTNLGSNTWPIVRDLVDGVVVVSEEDIVASMKLVWQRMKLVRRAALLGALFPHCHVRSDERCGSRPSNLALAPVWRLCCHRSSQKSQGRT